MKTDYFFRLFPNIIIKDNTGNISPVQISNACRETIGIMERYCRHLNQIYIHMCQLVMNAIIVPNSFLGAIFELNITDPVVNGKDPGYGGKICVQPLYTRGAVGLLDNRRTFKNSNC